MLDINSVLKTIREKLLGWTESLVAMLPNIVVAVVVLLAFWLAARVVKRVTSGIIDRMSRNDQVSVLFSRIAYLAVIVGGAMVALSILHLEKTVTSLLAGIGIIGLALGFAFQDLAANLMSGFLIAINEPLATGDLVRSQGFLGFVDSVSLRFTMLRTFEGQLVRIPNRMIFEEPLVNYSRTGERRIDIEVGVAYGEDLKRVQTVAVEAVEEVEERNREKSVELYFREFGSSSIDFSVRFWIDYPGHNYFEARSDAIRRIKEAFDENDITIPFPIRTLDFKEVGGTTLRDAAPLLSRSDPGSSESS